MTKSLIVAVSALLAFTFAAGAQTPEPLTDRDFTLHVNQQTVSLGQEWNDALYTSLGKTTEDSFVGKAPFGDTNYKFYRHTFEAFDIYSSNLWWDSQNRDFDSYIVGQITIHSPTLRTQRGIAPGSSKKELINLYGEGETDNSDEDQWIGYSQGNKRISFEIIGGNVNTINMNYVDG